MCERHVKDIEHVPCHTVSKDGTFSSDLYKKAEKWLMCFESEERAVPPIAFQVFLSTSGLFTIHVFSTDSRPVGNVKHLPFRDMFHTACHSGLKPFPMASAEQTESLQSVNFLFYLFEYLFCCDLEAHQNWISSPATLRGSTNTCGAVTDLCERAARSSK